MITTTTETLNADTAATLLGQNTHNRPLSGQHVRHYAQQMLTGGWLPTGQTIQISNAGQLIDGQHRLHALILADKSQPGITLEFQVARGVPEQAFAVIDQGKGRSAADALGLAGYASGRNLASAAGYHLRISLQALNTAPLTDNGAVIAYVQAHPALQQALTLHSAIRSIVLSPALYAAMNAHAIEQGAPMSALREFAHGVGNGANLTPNSPALALRNWSLHQRLQNRNVPTAEQAYATFRALRAHIHNKPITRLASALNGDLTFDVRELAPKGRR